MYLKIVLNDKNIDVLKEPFRYVHYDEKAHLVLATNEPSEGIYSERTGQFYHIKGAKPFPAIIDVSDVDLIEINQTEYDTIKAELDKGDTIDQLLEKINLQAQEIENLENAVLELGEIVG